MKLIELFSSGQIILQSGEGRTLRTYLGSKLNCNPMRVSKKFASLPGLGTRYRQQEFCREKLIAVQEVLEIYEHSFLFERHGCEIAAWNETKIND